MKYYVDIVHQEFFVIFIEAQIGLSYITVHHFDLIKVFWSFFSDFVKYLENNDH